MSKKGFAMRALAIAACVVFGSLSMPQGKLSAELTTGVNDDHVQIGFFYHGSAVSISGASDLGTDLIIKISSPEGHEALRKKGKVAGFLWMTVGILNFKHVPALYFLNSSRKIEDILSKEEMLKYGIGYEAIEEHAEMDAVKNEDEKMKWFREFVKFKEFSKLYSLSSGNVSLTEKGGRQAYSILHPWPYQAPPGKYTVTVLAIKGSRVIETAETSVLVEQVGIIKYLAGMAKNAGALYGIVSVLAALGAGFGVGLVFRKGGGSH